MHHYIYTLKLIIDKISWHIEFLTNFLQHIYNNYGIKIHNFPQNV